MSTSLVACLGEIPHTQGVDRLGAAGVRLAGIHIRAGRTVHHSVDPRSGQRLKHGGPVSYVEFDSPCRQDFVPARRQNPDHLGAELTGGTSDQHSHGSRPAVEDAEPPLSPDRRRGAHQSRFD